MLRPMMIRRAAFFALLLPLAFGCKLDEPVAEATLTPKTKAVEAVEAPKINTAVATLSPTGCDPAPVWVGLESCHADGFVYATGRKTMQSSRNLANAVIAARARAAVGRAARVLDSDGKLRLDDSEVLYTHQCNDDWVALARIPKAPPPPKLPRCPDELLAAPSRPLEGCPDWTTRIAWRDGDRYIGVAVARGIHDPSLAPAAARARALASAQSVVRSLVGVDGLSATLGDAPMALEIADEKFVTCDEAVYAKIETVAKKVDKKARPRGRVEEDPR